MSELQKFQVTGLNGESGSSKTCIDIVKAAYRRARVATSMVPLSDVQIRDGMEHLVGIYMNMCKGMFGQLESFVVASGDYEAKEFQKILKVDPTSNITFPDTIKDEDTGKLRQPIDGAIVVVTSVQEAAPVVVIYNDFLASWDSVTGLTKSSPAPLSMKYENRLIDMLAERLADENSLPVPDGVAKSAALGRLEIASHYSSGRRKTNLPFY